MIRRLFSALSASLLLAGLCACAPTMANRGHMVDVDKLSEIKVGESTREDVVRIMGSPTQISTFDEKTWYYFGRSTKQYSFLDPEVIEQKALEVRFNDEGIVVADSVLDPTAARAIEPIDRRTPTYGHETTILEQLIGNLGHPGGMSGKESKK
jgi:outer membrane protein assembly factor BamE (lipoprotein component of BamABCDE complex)